MCVRLLLLTSAFVFGLAGTVTAATTATLSPPTDVAVTIVSPVLAHVSWIPLADASLVYNVYVNGALKQTASAVQSVNLENLPVDKTSVTVASATADQTAVSPQSAPVVFTSGVPGPVSSSVRHGVFGCEQIIYWNPADNSGQSGQVLYNVYANYTGADVPTTPVVANSPWLEWKIKILPSTTYTYWVTAVNAVGEGPVYAKNTFSTGPTFSEPTGVTATSISETSMTVSWQPVQAVPVPSMPFYLQYIVVMNDIPQAVAPAVTGATTANITKLTPGTQYKVVVFASPESFFRSFSCPSDPVFYTTLGTAPPNSGAVRPRAVFSVFASLLVVAVFFLL